MSGAEQERCTYCGLTRSHFGAVPLVRVAGRLYHAGCWVQIVAPSVNAPLMVN